MPATDLDAALAAIATLETLSDGQQRALSSIQAIRRNGEPFVDVHELFALFDVLYFRNLLLARVQVLWSPRLTLVRGLYFGQSFQQRCAIPFLRLSQLGHLKPPACYRHGPRPSPHPLLDCHVKRRLTMPIAVRRNLRAV